MAMSLVNVALHERSVVTAAYSLFIRAHGPVNTPAAKTEFLLLLANNNASTADAKLDGLKKAALLLYSEQGQSHDVFHHSIVVRAGQLAYDFLRSGYDTTRLAATLGTTTLSPTGETHPVLFHVFCLYVIAIISVLLCQNYLGNIAHQDTITDRLTTRYAKYHKVLTSLEGLAAMHTIPALDVSGGGGNGGGAGAAAGGSKLIF